ncbi:MAG: hypothetical protein KJ887_05500 [Candidatus Omnitrophica bacterium]|nr:hypothetical protein [Candidatus Omnitrophota bacterium]MBU1048027.1 hypothetical protein [Candidatus Omnitrophota bacterium]MBU1631262.1 hypothetical protein [Candidatus Omnitrophota bacterium]MBU1767067.1 hypothetical protein [Candidatus Omnitrophota bacterium]MBU1889397.1 hypothetical protein [Candidatus Omnitrophota bacterium]
MSKGKKALKVIGIIFGSLIALIIVVHIILNIVFGIQLRNKIAELKVQGMPMTIAEIVPLPVPDEENAALLYNKAFILMTTAEGGTPYIPNKERGTKNNVIKTITDVKSFSDISEWTDEQRNEIPQLINSRDMQYIYELLEEGSQKPKCNFNRNYEDGLGMRFPDLEYMRDTERLLCAKALLQAESGNTGKAFDTLIVGLKISNHLKDGLTLIEQLIRIACDGIIIECIESISDSKGISPEKANLIMNELSTHEGIEPFIKCMDGERLYGILVFEQISKGEISLRDMMGKIHGELQENALVFSLFNILYYRPIMKKDFAYYLTVLSKMQDNYNIPYYEYKNAQTIPFDQEWQQARQKFYIFTAALLPGLDRVRDLQERHQANIGVCRVGLALKLHKAKNGIYPEKLEGLAPEFLREIPTDPFSGKGLIYSRYIGGFKLYSLGPNMRDDYGTPRAKEQDAPANKDYDIVWESGS